VPVRAPCMARGDVAARLRVLTLQCGLHDEPGPQLVAACR
jgi:hypothetical protein